MDDEVRHKIEDYFAKTIEGGCIQDMVQILDEMIEDEVISEEIALAHEIDIAHIFDAGWFTCNSCGWTLPISDMAADVPEGEDDWICDDCK